MQIFKFRFRWLPKAVIVLSLASLTPPAHTQEDAVAVETARVETAVWSHSVSAVGSLKSQDSVMLRPEITGRIADINFTEGGPVQRGQLLVQLDDAVAQAELEQAEAALGLARSQYNRARQLTEQGFISTQARDESASELKVREASVSMAQAQLDKTRIRAPFDGLIGLRNVSRGDYVNAGQDLVPLESIDPLNVDFRIPEQYLGQVQPGSRIHLRFDALPDVARDGVVGAISPLVETGGRSILLRARVPNDDGALRPGMFARVDLRFADHEALVVPEASIAPSGDGSAVYVVDNGRVRRVEVVLGVRREGRVEVVGGVEEGDEILVSGLQKVSDGTPVRVMAAESSSDHNADD